MSNTPKLRRLNRTSGQLQRTKLTWGRSTHVVPFALANMTRQQVSDTLNRNRTANIIGQARTAIRRGQGDR